MKLKNPLHIIQIFDNSYEYDKKEKSYVDRKNKYKWNDYIISKSSAIENGILKLNKEKVALTITGNINLILLIDYNTKDEKEILERFNFIKHSELIDYAEKGEFAKQRYLTKQLNKIEYTNQGDFINKTLKWKCLSFKKEKQISVNLIWDYWEIGEPERDNFKIGELKINKPIEININGKRDFSMTGRQKRTFVERNFIIEYLGEISEYELIANNKAEFRKQIPKDIKRINLLKKLY